jgi:signal transduction histidine kinase
MDLDGRLPEPVEAAAYYLVCEALTNTARHAHASKVTVQISCHDQRLRVEVADDGRGGADMANGSGLRGLADRVAALDGQFVVSSDANGGSVIRAEIPCAW